MKNILKPIYLFADSQLLFWQDSGKLFLKTIQEQINTPKPKAAYLGASNSNNPQYFDLFKSAMDQIEISDCRMISLEFTDNDKMFLKAANLILLAGGDVLKGWQNFKNNGIEDLLKQQYNNGTILIGISAGAIQIGLYGWHENTDYEIEFFPMLQLLPFLIGVHEENYNWNSLSKAVNKFSKNVSGIGIPSGGGLIYYPENRVETIRFPFIEIKQRSNSSNAI